LALREKDLQKQRDQSPNSAANLPLNHVHLAQEHPKVDASEPGVISRNRRNLVPFLPNLSVISCFDYKRRPSLCRFIPTLSSLRTPPPPSPLLSLLSVTESHNRQLVSPSSLVKEGEALHTRAQQPNNPPKASPNLPPSPSLLDPFVC